MPIAVPLAVGGGVVAAGAGMLFLFRKFKPKPIAALKPLPIEENTPPARLVIEPAKQPVTQVVVVPENVAGRQGVVTTVDAAPGGDLIIRSAPSASAPMIGAAEKDGIVDILRDVDATFAEVRWKGGKRRPAAQGFARKQFVKLADAATIAAIKQRDESRAAADLAVPGITVAHAARELRVSVDELEAAASTVNATAAQLLNAGATLDDLQALIDRTRDAS